MLQEHDDADEHTPQHCDHHNCASFFGCGDVKGIGIFREDIKDGAFDNRASDRLLHMDEVDQENLDNYLSARGRWRRKFLRASSFMGALAAVDACFVKLARAGQSSAGRKRESDDSASRTHVIPSTKETVQLGVYDTNLPPLLTIDSGDSLSFPETWSGFLNELQPGVPIDTLVKIRMNNPGKGPQSIIGPIAVNKAEPGDVLEIRYKRIHPYEWGAVFNNPATLETGLLPQDYPKGQIKYVDLDLRAMTSKFMPNITIPLKPFQGTLGVAPPDGYFPPLSPGVTSSVPPGPHAGNLDLSELSEGSTLYIPVWKP
ncbi:MAG TPA: acetamidase/formamidase family protein, partial [Terriglobales bacterium]